MFRQLELDFDGDLAHHRIVAQKAESVILTQIEKFLEYNRGEAGFIVLVPKVIFHSIEKNVNNALANLGLPKRREPVVMYTIGGTAQLFCVDSYDPVPTVIPLAKESK